MSRFAPCRETDLVSVVRGCRCRCRGGGRGCVQPMENVCLETRVTGPNILRDPGFSSAGGGPGGNEIPESDLFLAGSGGNGEMVWSDGTKAPHTEAWCSESVAGRTKNWNYVGGVAQYVKATSGGESLQQAQQLMPVGLVRCEDVPVTFLHTPLSAVVLPGDQITWTYAISISGTVTSPTAAAWISVYKADFTLSSDSGSSFTTINGGTKTWTVIAPALSKYVRCFVMTSWGGIASSTATVSVDNGVLAVV